MLNRTTIFSFIIIAFITAGILFYFINQKPEIFKHHIIFTEQAPKPIGPYSQAVLTGNTLFVSGQIAINPKTGVLDTASIKTETERVMKNIGAILTAAQMNYSNIVKTTIYLADLKQFAEVNILYESYFKTAANNYFPARETVQVSALPKGAHIEISVIAVR
jgi:2-iminobutanoate/2-iminopropanoate deaminase